MAQQCTDKYRLQVTSREGKAMSDVVAVVKKAAVEGYAY
jgi:hypothetical protein